MSLDVYLEEVRPMTVFTANITHNMGRMAGEVDLYKPLWRPEEIPVERASELAPLLRRGLGRLVAEKDRLQEFNPENGWGNYDLLVSFTREYLTACETHPEAVVKTWR